MNMDRTENNCALWKRGKSNDSVVDVKNGIKTENASETLMQ